MIDPITVTYSVINITATVLERAKTLSNLRDKYQNAASTITAICAESSSISASLSQIQGLLLRDAANLESHFTNRPELRHTFDTALTGCEVVYACLEEEIQRLSVNARDADAMTWRVRCRFVWREDTMRDLLSQLRGQQMALNLLIQMLQLESLSELKQLMRDNNAMISTVAQRSRSLRETHPRIRVSSVFSADRDSVLTRSSTVASTIDQTEFEFDDAIVNSRAYRRALAAVQKRPGTSGTGGRSMSEPAADPIPDIGRLHIDDTPKEPEKAEEEAGQDTLETTSISTEKNISREEDISTVKLTSTEKDMSTEQDVSTENNIQANVEPAEEKSSQDDTAADSRERKASTEDVSIAHRFQPERKLSEDRTLTDSPGITTASFADPFRPHSPRVQRKPLPSGRHVLMPSASMSTLSSSSTAGASQYRKGSMDTVSRVSTVTTVAPSIFSTGSNPATNSSISLPYTIDSASEPDDNDADTLIERVNSSDAASCNSTSSDNMDLPNPELHTIQQQLAMSETSYLNKLNILRTFIEEPIARRWPDDAWAHLSALHQMPAIRSSSAHHLLEPFKDASATPTSAHLLLTSFRRWLTAAGPAYRAYFRQHPHTASALRARREADPAFAHFVVTFSSTHSLDDLLRQPLRRLAFYHQTWSRILIAATTTSSTNKTRKKKRSDSNGDLEAFAAELGAMKEECDRALRDAQHTADLAELHRRISALQPAYAEGLGLLEDDGSGEGRRRRRRRKLVRQEALACRANGKGAWKPVRCVLLDNYLFFGRWEKGGVSSGEGQGGGSGGAGGWYRKGMVGMKGGSGGVWWYLEKPIPVKDIQCSISGAPRKPSKASVLDEVPRGSELYPFFVQADEVVHLLAASTENERREWLDAISAAQREGARVESV